MNGASPHGELPSRLGFRIDVVTDDEATGTLTVDPALLQGLGVVHGAALFALADSLAASLVVRRTRDGHGATSDAHIRFLRPVAAGTVEGRATIVDQRERAILVEVRLSAGGALCAVYTASFRRVGR